MGTPSFIVPSRMFEAIGSRFTACRDSRSQTSATWLAPVTNSCPRLGSRAIETVPPTLVVHARGSCASRHTLTVPSELPVANELPSAPKRPTVIGCASFDSSAHGSVVVARSIAEIPGVRRRVGAVTEFEQQQRAPQRIAGGRRGSNDYGVADVAGRLDRGRSDSPREEQPPKRQGQHDGGRGREAEPPRQAPWAISPPSPPRARSASLDRRAARARPEVDA